MPDDKNIQFHNIDDETPELERAFGDTSFANVDDANEDAPSLNETEKADIYFENLNEDLLMEAQAEAEAEQELLEKRKKDRAKARKREAQAIKDAREKHERDMLEENERRARAELESAKGNGVSEISSPGVEQNNTLQGSVYTTGQTYEAQAGNYGGYEPVNPQPSFMPAGNDVAPAISESDYLTLRANYENSKNEFKSYGDNIPATVVAQYEENYNRFFEVQRQIDRGELVVMQPQSPVYDTPVYNTFSRNIEGDGFGGGAAVGFVSPGVTERGIPEGDYAVYESSRRGGSDANNEARENDYLQNDYKAASQYKAPVSNQPFNDYPTYHNKDAYNPVVNSRGYSATDNNSVSVDAQAPFVPSGNDVGVQPSDVRNGAHFEPRQFNDFEQQMAQRAYSAYSQVHNTTANAPSVEGHVANDFRVDSVARTRYESLKQKCADLNREVATYKGQDVPPALARKAEQANKLYSNLQSKVDNGSIVLTGRSSSAAGGLPTAAGTQVFYDRSRDNFSPSGKRTGDSHLKPAKTTFVGGPIGKYDSLKITKAAEFNLGSPVDRATRRSLRAITGVITSAAQSEQTGTARTAMTAQDRARDVANAAKTIKDLPRQAKLVYYVAQNAANSAHNINRFLQGKEMVARKDHAPLTLKQMDKAFRKTPFSSADKELLKGKFGDNISKSGKQVNRSIMFGTAKNKNLKEEIKKLQSKGSALSASERKHLKDLLDKKKAGDESLRKMHGLKRARAEAQGRNRPADFTSQKSAKKSIKNATKKNLKLSRADKGVLSRLRDKVNMAQMRKKLAEAMQARKQLLLSVGGIFGKAMRESEESAVQGLLGASRLVQNRYVRSTLKVSYRGAMFLIKAPGKMAAGGYKFGRFLDNTFNKGRIGVRIDHTVHKVTSVNRAVKKQAGKIAEDATRKVLNSNIYKELNGGLYNRAKRGISAKTPDKIKTRVQKGREAVDKIKTKRQNLKDKFNSLKERLKNSKVGKFFSKIGEGLSGIAKAFGFAKKALIKVGIAAAAMLLGVALIGVVITSIGGAASSVFLGDDGDDGRIDITKYVETLNGKEKDFIAKIDKIASDPKDKYTKITVDYQSGALVNNFKDILSMTAVYFNQDFSNQNAVKTYLEQLYDDSHYYTTFESEPYSCAGCESRDYFCFAKTDKFATNERKAHKKASDHYGEAGVGKNDEDRYGCKATTYSCTTKGHGVYNKRGCKQHNGGESMDKPCSCGNYKEKTVETTVQEYYCQGYYEWIGFLRRFKQHNDGNAMDAPCSCGNYEVIETEVETKEYYCQGYCDGKHVDYNCAGHNEIICRGDHIDLDINVMVLGLDEIFHADSSVNAFIVDTDGKVGNAQKGDEIGTFTVTYYCTEKYPHICNAGPPYKTASGTTVTPGRTIAVDTDVIPLKTHVIIAGHEYIAEDTGGAIKGNRIDIAVAKHSEALSLGKKTYKVYYVSGEEKTENPRAKAIPYLQYAQEAKSDENAFFESLVLQCFGAAKEPKIAWSSNRVNHDTSSSYTIKLQNFDSEHQDEAFTNAELNTFEYVKMSKSELEALAKERTGEDYSKHSIYNIITSVLIPYDKEHPDEYIVEPDSEEAKQYTFEGWTEENIEWVKNIYGFMDAENYKGLEKINQFSKDDVSYEGVVLEQGETEVTYYNQYDVRWKNLPYSSSTIGKSGCAPTSMAMIVSTLTDKTVDPIQMCNWAAKEGYYIKGAGTAWDFIPAAAAHWGLPCKDMGKGNTDKVVKALAKGKLVIMSTGSGSYYQGDGHFLVLRGVDKNGKILVADPANKTKSETSWKLEAITSGLKNWWIIG